MQPRHGLWSALLCTVPNSDFNWGRLHQPLVDRGVQYYEDDFDGSVTDVDGKRFCKSYERCTVTVFMMYGHSFCTFTIFSCFYWSFKTVSQRFAWVWLFVVEITRSRCARHMRLFSTGCDLLHVGAQEPGTCPLCVEFVHRYLIIGF